MKQWTLVAIIAVSAAWMFKPSPADVRAGLYLAWQSWQARRAARKADSWTVR